MAGVTFCSSVRRHLQLIVSFNTIISFRVSFFLNSRLLRIVPQLRCCLCVVSLSGASADRSCLFKQTNKQNGSNTPGRVQLPGKADQMFDICLEAVSPVSSRLTTEAFFSSWATNGGGSVWDVNRKWRADLCPPGWSPPLHLPRAGPAYQDLQGPPPQQLINPLQPGPANQGPRTQVPEAERGLKKKEAGFSFFFF